MRLPGLSLIAIGTGLVRGAAVQDVRGRGENTKRGGDGTMFRFEKRSSLTVDIPFRTSIYFQEFWTFNATVGTPPQNIIMALTTDAGDTGLSNTTSIWNSPSQFFEQDPGPPEYNASLSSTSRKDILDVSYYNFTNTVTDIFNNKRVGTNLSYGSDNFNIGGVSLSQMPFIQQYLAGASTGSSTASTSPIQPWNYTLGLGLPSTVGAVAANNDVSGLYTGFLGQVKNQGLIQSSTYSIYSNTPSESSGHLILGGLNTARFKKPLVSPNTTLTSNTQAIIWPNIQQLALSISNLTVTPLNTTPTAATPIPVAGTATYPVESMTLNPTGYARFPVSVASAIWDAVGASYYLNSGGDVSQVIPSVPCSYLTNSSTLDISFVGVDASVFTMHVPMSDLTYRNGTGPNLDEGPLRDGCRFNLLAQVPGLPGAFSPGMLRWVYVVYDSGNQKLSVANPDWTTGTSDNFVAIPSGGVSLLGESVLGSATASSSSAATLTAGAGPGSSGGGGSSSAVGIGVGVGVGAAALLAIGAGFFWWRRKKNKKHQNVADGGGTGKFVDQKIPSDGSELMSLEEGYTKHEMAGQVVGHELESGDRKDGRGELPAQNVAAPVRYELGS
ncbi:uncharacterized protein PAC_09256 [Phialocephala subalpina]|uniref:Peptidase A1 domain-containing protein n=1 Tax=Phialocephala subalpina TaxID=576137 RepID=A0A1L7X2W8_9HELO|nr:uncharacterized protein PAC_09256 [Phialocephala subalpina]